MTKYSKTLLLLTKLLLTNNYDIMANKKSKKKTVCPPKLTPRLKELYAIPKHKRPRTNIQVLEFLGSRHNPKLDADLREGNKAHFFVRIDDPNVRHINRIEIATLDVTDEQYTALRSRAAYMQGYGKEIEDMLRIVIPALKKKIPDIDVQSLERMLNITV